MPGGGKTWERHRVTTEIMYLMGLTKVGLFKEVAFDSIPDRREPHTCREKNKDF